MKQQVWWGVGERYIFENDQMYKSWERILMGPQRQCLVEFGNTKAIFGSQKIWEKIWGKKNKEEKCKRKGIREKKSERKQNKF